MTSDDDHIRGPVSREAHYHILWVTSLDKMRGGFRNSDGSAKAFQNTLVLARNHVFQLAFGDANLAGVGDSWIDDKQGCSLSADFSRKVEAELGGVER